MFQILLLGLPSERTALAAIILPTGLSRICNTLACFPNNELNESKIWLIFSNQKCSSSITHHLIGFLHFLHALGSKGFFFRVWVWVWVLGFGFGFRG